MTGEHAHLKNEYQSDIDRMRTEEKYVQCEEVRTTIPTNIFNSLEMSCDDWNCL